MQFEATLKGLFGYFSALTAERAIFFSGNIEIRIQDLKIHKKNPIFITEKGQSFVAPKWDKKEFHFTKLELTSLQLEMRGSRWSPRQFTVCLRSIDTDALALLPFTGFSSELFWSDSTIFYHCYSTCFGGTSTKLLQFAVRFLVVRATAPRSVSFCYGNNGGS